MIFQHFNLIHNRTIKENLAFALRAGDYPKDQQARIKELLEMVDLPHKIHEYPNNLSGEKSNGSALHERLPTNLRFCCVTKLPVR